MTDPLDELLAQMPSEEASDQVKEAFMEKVMATPGGAELIRDFASKITAGGSLDQMLREEEARALQSPIRYLFRVELLGTEPLVWRRVSLPADCAYHHLHLTIQDAFGWSGEKQHRFEVWEDGVLELTFGQDEGTDYCELENHVADLFRENVLEFQYLYGLRGEWRHRVVIEKMVPAGHEGTVEGLGAHLHGGERHGPPEDCGGVLGYQQFLAGDHPLCRQYSQEVLQEFRTGDPDLAKLVFRSF